MRSELVGPPMAITWLVYWLACSAMLLVLMAIWDSWFVPKTYHRLATTQAVPPSIMAVLALVIGCAIPMLALRF
jgi:hypothetical protein